MPTRRIMSITLGLGTRLPAYATSMGRVLLADLPADQLDRFLGETQLGELTPRTITDQNRMHDVLAEVRAQGWALVDQELELGLRSVAAPIRGADERVVAAINVSAAASRVGLAQLRGQFRPALIQTAEAVSAALGRSVASR